jgi:IS5 family transposase
MKLAISSYIKVSNLGRDRNCNRVMLGLLMLQMMYNFSDSLTSEEFTENMYWQYFCGYEYIDTKIAISESSIRRFRNLLGEEGINEVLKELLRLSVRVGVLKKKDLKTVIVDSTVQIKNIKYPHDVTLMDKARKTIIKLFRTYNIALNDTYAKLYKILILKIWKYKEDSKSKKRIKLIKKLKTLLGRLIRLFKREIDKRGISLLTKEESLLSRIESIHAQSALKPEAKKEYKKENEILYSLHAPEVRCIGKGKVHKPYEFGNKVNIVTSKNGNLILCAKSFSDNPYDGHTLKQTIEQVEKNTELKIDKVFVDLGYRSNNFQEKSKVYTPYTKKKLKPDDKKMLKRRSSIEPIIGHLKQYCRLGRNYLYGKIGDIINPILSAIGLNLRAIANYLSRTGFG